MPINKGITSPPSTPSLTKITMPTKTTKRTNLERELKAAAKRSAALKREAASLDDHICQLMAAFNDLDVDPTPPPSQAPKAPTFQRGTRVRCTRRDQYHLREGVLLGLTGGKSMYWRVLLDKAPNAPMKQEILKTEGCLQLLAGS